MLVGKAIETTWKAAINETRYDTSGFIAGCISSAGSSKYGQ